MAGGSDPKSLLKPGLLRGPLSRGSGKSVRWSTCFSRQMVVHGFSDGCGDDVLSDGCEGIPRA